MDRRYLKIYSNAVLWQDQNLSQVIYTAAKPNSLTMEIPLTSS